MPCSNQQSVLHIYPVQQIIVYRIHDNQVNRYECIRGNFYHNGLILSNHMPRKVWDEITYPFPNFNG